MAFVAGAAEAGLVFAEELSEVFLDLTALYLTGTRRKPHAAR